MIAVEIKNISQDRVGGNLTMVSIAPYIIVYSLKLKACHNQFISLYLFLE